LTVALTDCSAANGSAIVASANDTSATADPNPAPNNASSATIQVSNATPVITASGALDTTVECATSYTDAGATAADACEGSVAVSSTSTVDVGHVGNYSVTYTAADRAGGQATPVVRSVHVADTTPPIVTLIGANPAAVECGTAFADPGATAADSCAGPVPVMTTGAVDARTPGSYTLGYAATDPSGNTGRASRVVNVGDHTVPTITVVAPIRLDPDHELHRFAIADLVRRAIDSCSSVGIADVKITKVTSDERDDDDACRKDDNHGAHDDDECGHGHGHGTTARDIAIGSDCRSVTLSAERDGGGNGRVYTIFVHVTDVAGNRADAVVKVMVPRNPHVPTAIDDGPKFTVNSSCP
jgi:hypothetical protein